MTDGVFGAQRYEPHTGPTVERSYDPKADLAARARRMDNVYGSDTKEQGAPILTMFEEEMQGLQETANQLQAMRLSFAGMRDEDQNIKLGNSPASDARDIPSHHFERLRRMITAMRRLRQQMQDDIKHIQSSF